MIRHDADREFQATIEPFYMCDHRCQNFAASSLIDLLERACLCSLTTAITKRPEARSGPAFLHFHVQICSMATARDLTILQQVCRSYASEIFS